jgi:PAS domain S-box-containing protein
MSNGETASLNLPRARSRAPGVDAKKLSGPVRPLISALAVMAISGMLVVTILLTRLSVQWITFLTGVLIAALLAEATRVSRAEWTLMRRTAQLSSAKDKLEREARLRKTAEQAMAAGKPRLHLIDEVLSTMVVLVDADGRCRYHNRAFRDWLHLRQEQIEGVHLNEVLGARAYQEIASHVRAALDGHPAKYRRVHRMPDGSVRKLAVTHVPQYAEGGKVTGFYMLADDVAEAEQVVAPSATQESNQELFLNTFSNQLTGQDDGGAEIVAAIEKNEFRLFCQTIAPLSANAGRAEFYEILVRLMEEEEGLIPPGAFFPLAEKFGMMSRLDRWVVQHVAEWIAIQVQQKTWPDGSVYFINLSSQNILDHGFTDYLEVTVQEYGIPAAGLCFEISNTDLGLHGAAVAEFTQRVKKCGARIALSGFGRDAVEFGRMRGLHIDFLKIDGSTLLAIPHDPVALAKVTAINQVARTMGVKTIAEMVESETVLAKLREIGVDFAQGFGISRPRPLSDKAGGGAQSSTGPDDGLLPVLEKA